MVVVVLRCCCLSADAWHPAHTVCVQGAQLQAPAHSTPWPRPENLLQLRQFLGLTTYFRRVVQGYAARVTPLVRLTLEDMPFVWSSECHEASKQLKEYLVSAPVLAMPDFSKAWELVSDACGFAIGAVLLQEGRPVAYYARSLSSAEKNYHATDQELLGCGDALKHWRCYLEGAEAHKFTLVLTTTPLFTCKHRTTYQGAKHDGLNFCKGSSSAGTTGQAELTWPTVSVACLTWLITKWLQQFRCRRLQDQGQCALPPAMREAWPAGLGKATLRIVGMSRLTTLAVSCHHRVSGGMRAV